MTAHLIGNDIEIEGRIYRFPTRILATGFKMAVERGRSPELAYSVWRQRRILRGSIV